MVDLPNPWDSRLIDVKVCHLVTPEAVEMTFKESSMLRKPWDSFPTIKTAGWKNITTIVYRT